MNITFFTPTLKLSGGNIVMFKYASALAECGHNVTVIAPHSEVIDKIENGVHIKTFKKFPNKYFEHIFFQLIYLNKFFDLTPKSDVIIPIFFPLAIHAIYCKKRGKTKKIISLFQDYKEMYWYGNYIFFLLRFKCITEQIDKFIAVSNPISEQIKTCANNDIVVIPNGIEHECFYPRNCEKENYILFVGSSSKNKGVEYFLKAFELVKKDFPELKAKIVSPNNEKFENSDIEVINVGKNRTLLGEIYSKALVYVSQSFGDSFGLPPLEAMACGTAVVLTDTTGAKEYAQNNKNCLVVPPKNAKCTAQKILTLLKESKLRSSLEIEGIKTSNKYKWDVSFRLFEEIISGKENLGMNGTHNKIIIEDGLSIVQQRGCGQYTLRIFDCLKGKYVVTMKRKYLLEKIQNNIIRRVAYILWLNTVFVLKTLFQKSGTICLFTSFLTPIIKLPHVKYYSVLHDTGLNDNPTLLTKSQLLYGLFANWTAVYCSDKLITVSETTKNNILKYYKIKPEKISIVYNTPSLQSVEYDENETILKKHNIKPKSYIFFVGGISKNKNVQSLIDAFNKISGLYPNLELIIAGNKGNDNTNFVINDKIKFVGFISNEDVKVLYKNALLFVFPSLYEGFGIPLIDAQMMGVPVICTDMSIFREVANDAAMFVEPNGNSIAKAITSVLNDKIVYENLVQKGYENYKRFEFNKIQNQIVGVIEENAKS